MVKGASISSLKKFMFYQHYEIKNYINLFITITALTLLPYNLLLKVVFALHLAISDLFKQSK